MRRLVATALLALAPIAALSQASGSAEEDKGFLTNWLETNLSGAGREIRIDGFSGALSSTASLDKLTIADDQGIWITLEDVTLNWDRGALFEGALEVNELSASSIDLVRWPTTEKSEPSPEATEFQLPDLPVSIQIQEVSAAAVTLGEAILGESATVSLNGSVQLIEGQGDADISILRIDEKVGSLTLAAGYSNTTKVLDLALAVEEEEDGILVNLLKIPDRPSVSLKADGNGPTTDFSADIALATNSSPRVTGAVRLTAETATDGGRTNLFQADLAGDIAPLVAEQYREFFGGASELRLAGAVLPDKRLQIKEFKLASAALDLSGTLALSDDGLPEEFDVKGSINAVDGTEVVLPIGGPETRIKSATLTASFKAGKSDEWTFNANFLELARDDISISDAVLMANGLIQRVGTGETEARRVTAKVETELFGVELTEVAISGAIGDNIKASATLDWQDGGPVKVGFLDISSGDLSIGGAGTVEGFDSNFRVDAKVTAAADSLGRFSALAGQPLAGAAEIVVAGWFEPLGGAFDGSANGTTTALRLRNSPFLDLISGNGSFNLKARRGTDGLFIDTMSLRTSQLEADLEGELKTNASDLRTSLSLANVANLVQGISGPARLNGTARQTGPDWLIDIAGTGPGGSSINAGGTIAGSFDTVGLDVTGSVPIGLANNFLSPATDIQGTANLNLSINGAPSLNAISGTISTTNARVSAPAFRIALRRIDAAASLSGGVANIDLDGQFSTGGQATVDGTIGMAAPFATDLLIGLRNAEFADPPIYTTTANGQLNLQGALAGEASLGGSIDLSETEIRLAPTTTTQGIPDITHINDRPAVEQTRARAGLDDDAAGNGNGAGPARAINLDIAINAPSRIFIRGRGLDTELGGRLRLTGTTADVIPIGQFTLVRGRLDILGKRLDMQEGQLLLQGSFDPRFRMVASTDTANATVRIITEGTPQSPNIVFESDPDLPDDEILANLLFGKSIASISPLQAAQLAAAVAALAGSGGDGVIGKIRNQFNLDDLDITTDEEGAAGLRAGKYLSENVYTDIEVTSEGRSEINLNLDLTPNITAKGSVGSDGDTGLGIFYERDY